MRPERVPKALPECSDTHRYPAAAAAQRLGQPAAPLRAGPRTVARKISARWQFRCARVSPVTDHVSRQIPVNAVLAVLGLVFGLALVVFVTVRGKVVQKKQAKEDAEGERAMLQQIEESESEYGTF